MAPDGNQFCPTFTPTKEQFSKPFCDYVKAIFKKHPGLAMFKVKPPKGWAARSKPFPSLGKVEIACPIKQMAFGTKGAYRCLLIEQKGMTAAEFKEVAEDDDHRPQSNNTRGEVRARRGALPGALPGALLLLGLRMRRAASSALHHAPTR
jgi:jumonji domain-containing protein 2